MRARGIITAAISAVLVSSIYFALSSKTATPTSEKNWLEKFEAKNISEKVPALINQSTVKGKHLVLHLWASWCGVCKSETPVVKKLWNDIKGSKYLSFYAMATNDSIEDIQQTQRYKEKLFPLILDIDDSQSENFHVDAVPQTLVFNPAGELLHRFNGRLGEEDIEKILDLR